MPGSAPQILRLPLTVARAFQQWLQRNSPQKKDTVLGRIRIIRGGKLNYPGSARASTPRTFLLNGLRKCFVFARR
jgi:hypothetical protein